MEFAVIDSLTAFEMRITSGLKTFIEESIEVFKIRYKEIFDKEIPYTHIKVNKKFLRGFSIVSREELSHDGPDEGTQGLEIQWSDYRDVHNTSIVPDMPFRHLDIIYRYSNKERAIEYNPYGLVVMEIAWNADNEPYYVQYNTDVDTTHMSRALQDVCLQIWAKTYKGDIPLSISPTKY